MKRPTASSRIYLASSVTEKTLVANSDERLHSILATLEQCQAALIASGNRETAQLLSVAVLELRIKINRIADSELKALCDVMVREDGPIERPQKSPSGQRAPRAGSLKLVE